MWIDDDLPADIAHRIKPLCEEGDALSESDPMQAISKYRLAFDALPLPKEQWLAATWILIAIGDTAYTNGDPGLAKDTFQGIDLYEGWHANPFVRLRRGQVAFDAGELDRAANEFALAFMAGGYEIFDNADDKYAEFGLSKLLPPEPPIEHRLARFHLQPQKPWWKFW